MPEGFLQSLESGAWEALALLLKSGFIYMVFAVTRDIVKGGASRHSYWKALLVCSALAAVGAAELGNPSCEQSDPIHGGCEYYDEDGFEPTQESRYEYFSKLFLLLFLPAAIAIAQERKKAPDLIKAA